MSKKTMEELCITRTTGDLWNELHTRNNLTTAILHNLLPNANYIVRFLGPFIKAKRCYTGCFSPIMNRIDIKSIVNGNSEAYQEALKVIDGYYAKDVDGGSIRGRNRRREFDDAGGRQGGGNYALGLDPLLAQNNMKISSLQEAQKQLTILSGKSKYWQNCIMVNALCEPFTPQSYRNPLDVFINVFVLSPTICDKINIASVPYGGENCRINGMVAHSIQISKTGHGLQSKYNVAMLPEDILALPLINKIVEEGLYDIPVVAKACNNKKTPFIYNVERDYRMPTLLMTDIMEEYKKFEENKHFNRTEEQINDVPLEAFENRNIMGGGIDSLEV